MSSDSDYTSSLCHHTHKRKKIIISDSSSDESIIVQTRKKKKTYRVISEGETSSDDDSDVPKPVIRRQNYRVISEDEFDSSASEASKSMESDSSSTSEWQSDWTTSDELSGDTIEYRAKRKVLSKTKKEKVEKAGPSLPSNANISSDSGDEQSEKCPICLLPFSKQQVGTPSVCEHCFCLDCLLEWCKNINTCPVDRQSFTVIHVKNHFGGEIIKHLPVEVVPRVENQAQDDPTFCEVCHQSDREERMLLCDNCDRGYHLECLTPPMTAVPIEEWYCPECLRRSSRSVSNFVPSLVIPRRPSRRILQWNGRDVSELSGIFRMLPHIRERSYVHRNRSYISRIRNRISEMHDRARTDISDQFDPNLPSTSSGIDSIGDNSRSRSPNLLEDSASSTRSKTKSKAKRTRKKKHAKSSKRRASSLVREVRIKEFNDDGEEEEIVTYVKVASSTSRRKCKKRAKKTRKRRKHKRRARNQTSVVANTRTVKRRLASTLGMEKPKIPLLVPTMKSNISIPDRSALINSRYNAGIPQVSLFGDNLGLDYSPPGSDDEYSIGNGPMINVRQRRSAVPSIRRRAILKTITNPIDDADNANTTDLLSSIMNTMKLWHSTMKKDDVILKADGTLIVNNPNKKNKHSVNNNESPKKEKQDEREVTQRKEEVILKEVDHPPLDLSNVNPNDITQAPMYNNPCGGGGSGGGGNRGNFRGGYSRDNGRHGGQSYSGGRDSLPPGGGGRHNYSGGAGGSGPRDHFGNRDFGPPPFYNPNFEHCGGPPMFGAHAPPPPFRSRNPQHFRNERLRFPPPPPPPPPVERQPFNYADGSGGFEQRPSFPHAADRFPRSRPPPLGITPPAGPSVAQPSPPDSLNVQPAHAHNNLPSVNLPDDVTRNYQSPERNDRVTVPEPVAAPASARQDNDDCDIYCDIEPPSKPDCDVQDEHNSNGSMILLPPPEPPSGLLDFEENSRSDKDNDSEQELVIDDSHKEDTPKEHPSGDKYDPFAADSDSNDDATASQGKTAALQKAETSRNSIGSCNIPMPVTSSLSTSSYQPPAAATSTESRERQEQSIRLTAYDDDDDNNSQSDCPNFSVYSSQTMDVVRHTEQEMSQQLGPLQPPPLPPNIPDDDDIIVGDVQACDMPDVPPEPANPYVEALQKERQTLSKIPPKKISHDSHRGKIIFKIGNKLKLNNRLSGLHSDDHSVNSQNSSFSQKKAAVPPTDEQQQQQEQDNSSKPMAEVTIARPSLSLKSTKTEARFSDEDEKNASAELASQSEREHGSENSTDEETTKVEQRRVDASPDRNESENSEQEASPRSTNAAATDENVVAAAEIAISPTTTLDQVQLSPKSVDGSKLEHSSEDLESGEVASKAMSNRSDEGLRGEASACDDSWERESSNDDYDHTPSREDAIKANRDDKDDDKATLSDNEDPNSSSDQRHEKASSSFSTVDDEVEQFPIKKDDNLESPVPATCADTNWDSDGAYTPCKDELPVKDVPGERRATSFEVGLEPITPTKDRTNDDLDDCRTPTGYAGLGTEAISETDEAINFEEELNMLSLRKEKEMEDGEILDESKLSVKECDKSKEEKEDDNKRKKKKDKKEKSKESTEKNKENISSDNLVAWKKLSKSTKERPYRDKDKRSKSKEKEKEKDKDKDKDKSSKKKTKEVGKKKEKRKELPRYDVRKIVADKPRKDEYGRDIREKSRSRSKSRSPNKIRSGSRDRRSRSYSKGRSRSRSRLRLSWSRDRNRSYSRSCRSTSRRKSTSRTRRRSPRKRSVSRRGSLSRRHSVSRRRSRSLSRKRRSLSPRRRSRRTSSRSRDKRKDKTKKYKSRSRSRNRKRSRSKSPKRASSKSREKKHSKRKAHSRSRSKGKSVSRDRDRNRNWEQLNEKSVDREQQFTREQEEHERSWSAQWTPSWSRSRSKTPPHIQQERLSSRNWSPPPVLDSVSPKNLTVILTNKEAIKKKKKERRKESRKSKETEKRRKGKRNRTPPPSKEVFASGDNILVSVCFNKDNETNPTATSELPSNTIPLVPPIKRRRRESVQTESTPSAKRSKKEKSKDKRSKSPKVKKDKKKKSKAAEIAATKKPVAVIDLDQSPFREQTPSPRDVIVLSDDDDKQAQEALAASPEQCPPEQASPPREQFVSQGPKTPPEPQIKFSINKQPSNLRPSLINPLLEEEEEEEEEEEMMDEQAEEELEMRAQEELELRLKIGPNTPPEPPTSPPTSPDAYDPFDPTKSRSPTPDASQEATSNDEHDRAQRNSPRKHDGATDTPLPLDEPSQQQDQPSQEKPPEKPKIISMVTIKRPSPPMDVSASPVPENQTDIAQSCNSPPKTQQNPQNVQSTANPFATINPVLATVAAAVQRSFNTSTPNTAQRTLLQPNRISPSSQTKQRTNDRPQLPNVFTNSAKSSTMARSSKSNQSKNSSTIGQNGSDATSMDTTNDNVVDMSSPYSPGSTLSDGLFDPPSPANFNNSPVANAPPPAAKANTPKVNKSAEKKDTFDALFGGLLPPVKTATKSKSKKVAKEKTKKSTNPKVGVRMDENQLQILDDLPSSAVEMQVKDKFLKKLNRQERVVEEVKLVLKPHYTKKHVTKEEYKDIMRKAVPKICHNKTGEINPKKIAHLIEAYVRKCRNNKKKTIPSTKIAKSTKTLWS